METISESRLLAFLKETDKTILTSQDLQNVFGFKSANSRRVSLHRFLKKGHLAALGRGLYANSLKFPEKFAAATALVSPSYVSFESALSYHGVLSQIPHVITMATTKKSHEVRLLNQTVKYIHLMSGLFWGYQKSGEALIAEPEKALLDTLYLQSKGLARLNYEELDASLVDSAKLNQYAKAYPKLCLPKLKFKN